jgi:hypothetical protein
VLGTVPTPSRACAALGTHLEHGLFGCSLKHLNTLVIATNWEKDAFFSTGKCGRC